MIVPSNGLRARVNSTRLAIGPLHKERDMRPLFAYVLYCLLPLMIVVWAAGDEPKKMKTIETKVVEKGLVMRASMPEAFVVGSAPAYQPLVPGCSALVPLSGSVIVPFTVSGPPVAGQGGSTTQVAIPPTVPPGTAHAVQAAILDPGAPLGWSATNGLALVFR